MGYQLLRGGRHEKKIGKADLTEQVSNVILCDTHTQTHTHKPAQSRVQSQELHACDLEGCLHTHESFFFNELDPRCPSLQSSFTPHCSHTHLNHAGGLCLFTQIFNHTLSAIMTLPALTITCRKRSLLKTTP